MSDEQQPIYPQESAPPPVETSIPARPEPIIEPTPIEQPKTSTQTESAPIISVPQSQQTSSNPKSFLAKALESIQFRKKAKLEKIVKLANEKKSITNDQVEKLLHCSDATATRYLSELVKNGQLQRIGHKNNPTYQPTRGSIGGN